MKQISKQRPLCFTLNTDIYPLESILNTCYAFTERLYIFLDTDSKAKNIEVSLKGKNRISQNQLESLKQDFTNELLHWALRYKISKGNKKIREMIVGRALCSALPDSDLGISDEKTDYLKDPLGIAIPWEEKYGKKKKNEKIKV